MAKAKAKTTPAARVVSLVKENSSDQALKEELERLKRENASLKSQTNGGGTYHMKVSAKGALSVYIPGLRFPITLYKQTWQFVFEREQEIKDFIRSNEAQLKVKE